MSKRSKRNEKQRLFGELIKLNIWQKEYRGCNVEIISYGDTTSGKRIRLRGIIHVDKINRMTDDLLQSITNELAIRYGITCFISRDNKRKTVLNIDIPIKQGERKNDALVDLCVTHCNRSIDLIHMRINELQNVKPAVADCEMSEEDRIKTQFSELVANINEVLDKAKKLNNELCDDLLDDLTDMLYDNGYLNPLV